jgi:tellurium resistance protein TerD
VGLTLVKGLIKGEKVVINKINDFYNNLSLDLIYQNQSEMVFALDSFIFMLYENNMVNKKDIVFYNNPENTSKSIRFNESYDEMVNLKKFDLDLNAMPGNISKLILGCSVYNPAGKTNNLSVGSVMLKILNKSLNVELFDFCVENDFSSIEAVIIGEIYKHNEFWKFNAAQHVSDISLLNMLKTIYNVNFY